jgi:hypothetical protein
MTYNGKNSDISNWYNGGSSLSVQPRQPVVAPRPSQIPGLGMQQSDPSSSSESRQMSGIRDTDSDYVKLAKRGGQPNLLHAETNPSTMSDQRSKRHNPSSYQRADWYYDDSAEAKSSAALGGSAAVEVDRRFKAPPMSPGYEDTMRALPYGASAGDNNGALGDMDNYDRNEYYDDERIISGGQTTSGRTLVGTGGRSEDAMAYNRGQSMGGNMSASSSSSQYGSDRLQSGYGSVSHSDYGYKVPADNTGNSNNHNVSSERHHHVNRMIRENSSKSDMSKLLSFGYLQEDSTNGKLDRTAMQRVPSGQSDYKTEYQSKMVSDGRLDSRGGGTPQRRRDSGDGIWPSRDQQESTYSGKKPVADDRPDFFRISSREERSDFNIRKHVEDDRPDFFKIGGDRGAQPVIGKPPQFGRRKASSEQRPDFFVSEAAYEPTQAAKPAFARMKYDPEAKPDFFNIGSNGQQQIPVGKMAYTPDGDDDMDVLDKVSGYSSLSRTNFRRKKTDPNAGIWAATPVRSGAK